MQSVSAALNQGSQREIEFSATVTSQPSYFYGKHSRAEHETFGIRSDDGATLRVVDNVKIAPQVGVHPGDRIVVKGELVPWARGGPIVHWTHHDPGGTHAAGFIEWNGRRYA